MTKPDTLKIPPVVKCAFAWRLAIGAVVIVFCLGEITVVMGVCRLPNVYASTVHLRLNQAGPDQQMAFSGQETVLSRPVLEKVIRGLNLNQKWGDQFFDGHECKTDESYELLKACLKVETVNDSTVIAVTANGTSPQEAAQIANTVAAAYQGLIQAKETQDGTQTFVTEHPVANSIQILDQAIPPTQPCKPNRPVSILIGTCFVIVISAMAGGLAYSTSWLLGLPISWSRPQKKNTIQLKY